MIMKMENTRKKKIKCKHKWHFMEKEIVGGATNYKYCWPGGWLPISSDPIEYTNAIFVCEDCGDVKKVKIKKKEVIKNGNNI